MSAGGEQHRVALDLPASRGTDGRAGSLSDRPSR